MRISLLALALLASTATVFAQDIKVTIPRNNCENARGSQRASEFLQTLRNLPVNLPGRDDAIFSCDAKVQALKKTEDETWNRGVQAQGAGQCPVAKQAFQQLFDQPTAYQKAAGDRLHALNCSSQPGPSDAGGNVCSEAPRNIQNARGAYRAGNTAQAKTFATAAQSCPSTADDARQILDDIDRTEKSRKLEEQANLALLRKDADSACKFILQIDAAYAGLKDLRRKAGDCVAPPPPPSTIADARGLGAAPPDPLLSDYNRANGLLNSRPAEAERILQSIYAKDKEYKDVSRLLKEVRDDLQNKDFAELEKQAHTSFDSGDVQTALGRIERAITLRPNESRLRNFKETVLQKAAAENKELGSAIDAYYGGKYSEARGLLTTFLRTPHSGRVRALARFYAGAAAASEYYLSGQADASRKEEAKLEFNTALQNSPQFSPDWSKLSPKIRSIFLEATGKPGQK